MCRVRRLIVCLLCLFGAAGCAPSASLEGDQMAGVSGTWRHWQPAAGEDRGDGPSAVVLALHGFNDYSNAFQYFASYARDHGVAVHAYDQRGFGSNPDSGLWPGTTGLTTDLRKAVARLRQIYGARPLYILGESMGGAVTIVTATEGEPLDIDGIILVAPAVWGGAHMNLFYRATLWLAATVAPGWKLKPPAGLEIWPSDNIEMLQAFSADPLVIKETRTDAVAGLVRLMDQALASADRLDVDLLLLIGEKDEIVPLDALRDFQGRLKPGRVTEISYPEGYHMLLRDLQREVVFADILAWIEARAPAQRAASSPERQRG